MHLGEDAIAALVKAALAAEQDVFLTPSVPFRPAHGERLCAALGRHVFVFLPGDYYPFGEDPARCFFYEPFAPSAREYRLPSEPCVCWADIRLAGDPAFAAALEAAAPAVWVLPFASCADPAEPGCRESYRLLAELRAESRRFSCVAALFDAPPQTEDYAALFGSRGAVFVQGGLSRVYPAALADSEAEKLELTLRECRKQYGKRVAVFFPTRRQAESFYRALRRQGTPCAAVHGGRPHTENAAALSRFLTGELNVLCATGHALSSAPFLSADRALYCGLPMSPALAARAAALLPADESLLCVHTREDLAFNERIARSRAEALSLPEEEFVARRKELGDALLRQLQY